MKDPKAIALSMKGKSTRTHFGGVGTKLEQGHKGDLRGSYRGTQVATKDPKGNIHLRTGGWLTPTTVTRMKSFIKEHGGKDVALSRAKGTLSGRMGDKKLSSGYVNGEHRMTIKR